MKKVISIIALVVAMVMAMSVSAFAADPVFSVVENENVEVDGSVIPKGTTVTPAADSIAVETASVAGNYYGILLVEGDALPTKDSAILYIDQATAADVKQAFSVLPIIPKAGTKLTLYISSNVAGAELIAIPMVYDAEEEVIVPTYQLAELDGDGSPAGIGDALEIINFANFEPSVLDSYVEDMAAMVAMAEIDGDGSPAGIGDALEIINFANFEPSALDSIYGM